MSNGTCIIIGASHAASQLGPDLRKKGWQGRILIITDESVIPYHRPPLSKEYLSGKKTFEQILIKKPALYEKNEVEFLLDTRVTSINRGDKNITLDNGETLAYDKLALTTGARVRHIPVPGAELDGVHYLRDANDVEKIMPLAQAGKKAVIIGGGYIGLETAAVLQSIGMEVTVIEMMERVLERVTTAEVSAFYHRIHTEQGVHIVTGASVTKINGDDLVESVTIESGDNYSADLVIVGIGVIPNTELAEEAGLEVSNGIVVDEYCRTSDHDIVAAGDCTWHYNPFYEKHIRLESVQNALDQARVAAATLNDDLKPYDTLPWFWSDQYDLKLQIQGLSAGYDEVIIRGDIDSSRKIAVFYLKEGRILSVDAVNSAPEFMVGKKLILAKTVVDKEKLADAEISIKELMS